jgi:hypothetical protein
VVALAFLLLLPSRPAAHEIPPNVTARVLVKAEDDRLRMLVRVPLAAFRDLEFPVEGPQGYLVPGGRLEPRLRVGARLWLADYIRILPGDGEPLRPTVEAVRVSLPNDRSWTDWETARAHLAAGLFPGGAGLRPEHALVDVLLEAPLPPGVEVGDVVLEPALAHLGVRTRTVLRYLTPGGDERVFQWEGDPGQVRLDPGWHHAAFRFAALGFHHVLEGLDHILFLLCLVIPIRRLAPLVGIATAFAVAHSITLAAAAFGFAPDALWFPPLVESLIALSILWMALDNILGARLRGRWLLAFGFGLVHGFGFSFLLRESLQFAGSHVAVSLLAFNVGVELAQIAFLVAAVPVLGFVLGRVVAERPGIIVLSALVAHTAWHWMTERGSDFLSHEVALPPLDLFLLADLMRWGALLLVAGAVAWGMGRLYDRLGWGGEGRKPSGVPVGVPASSPRVPSAST